MKSLKEFIIEQQINEDFNQYLLDELRVALHCWSKTGINYDLEYYSPKIFEEYKYNFNNCSKVVQTIIDHINDDKNTHNHHYTFKFDNIVFFDKLQIDFTLSENSCYVKSKSQKNVVYLRIRILNKTFDNYDLRQRRFFVYSVIHELTHAYSDYLLRLEGKPSIIYLMKGNYEKEYRHGVYWMRPFTENPDTKSLLGKCRYFLDSQEMIAYLGTVKETVKNVVKTVIPSYKDLKFDEILEMFSKEYIWSEYLNIAKFVEDLDNIDKDELIDSYKIVFEKDIDYDELIKEIKDKWETFKSEFVEAFIESYADCEQDMKFESFTSFDLGYFEPFSKL